MPAPQPAAAPAADFETLVRLFDLAGFTFDLEGGVVLNPARQRDVYLSADLARGIYEALVEETGPAWKTLLYHCGTKIGARVVARLDRDVRAVAGTPLADLGVEVFQKFVEEYFAANGWGVMRVDFTRTFDQGVVEATLEHSFWADVLFDVDDYVDGLTAGLLAGLLGGLAGTELACLEAESPRKGAARAAFLVSAPARIEALAARRDEGAGLEPLRQALLA